MTNEEKATQIANNAKKHTYFDSRCNDLVGNTAFASAMIMSEWKDQQFKNYLNNKLTEVQEKMTISALNDSFHITRHYEYAENVIKDILKEFFNEN